MNTLTDADRKVLDDAEALLKRLLTTEQESLMFSLHHGWEGLSVTYFTPNRVQHGSIWPLTDHRPTLADKMQTVLEIRAEEEGRSEQIRAEHIARLQRELASLTGEAA